jgi:hypothetical protein
VTAALLTGRGGVGKSAVAATLGAVRQLTFKDPIEFPIGFCSTPIEMRNFPTHGQLSAAQGSPTSCLNFDFAILNLFEPSAL